MTHEAFERVLQEQLTICTDILCRKSKEYSTDADKLHNFKNAADLQGISQIQALSGMMAKHTISIYDMCMSGKTYPIPHWEEKITDSINYLLLLKGIIVEEASESTTEKTSSAPTQAEYEEMFEGEDVREFEDYSNCLNGATPAALGEVKPKGKYEGLSNGNLMMKICRGRRCTDCVINKTNNGYNIECFELKIAHPEEFRKIAIEWLEKEGKA
jgi:hypothetical protein